jgi:hypothetical protein
MAPVGRLHQCLLRSVERIASPVHADRIGPRFRLPSVDHRHPSSVGMGDAFFRAFVPAAKALSGAYEEGMAHAHHHQSLALGIGADALGELYWLPD